MRYRKGVWENISGLTEAWRCSRCHCFVLSDEYEKCPQCNAVMKGDNMKTQKEFQADFRKHHKICTFCLDKTKDKDIIKWLYKQSNQSEVIRRSLREAMKKK